MAATVISARWIAPIEPEASKVLENHAVAIDGDGIIVEILSHDAAVEKYPEAKLIRLGSHILTPGFVNAHTHTGLSLLKGKADDQPLMEWLTQTIWPAEMAFIAEESFCEDGARLAVSEMIRGGTTCFNDMYWFVDSAARVAVESGIRAVIGMIMIHFPSSYAANEDEYLSKGHKTRNEFGHFKNIHFAYSPHAPYTVPDATLQMLGSLSQENNLPLHIHLHETSDECLHSLMLKKDSSSCHMSTHASRPVANFERLGLLNSRLCAAHMVHLNEEEIELCARRSVSVVHCPNSNMKLASGFCPVAKLVKAGVNVAIGTDSAASNNSLDMLHEMKTAAVLGKAVAGDSCAIPASTALKMATLNGAKALGLDASIGSIVPGKIADLTAVDLLSSVETLPVYCPIATLVYSAGREHVSDVWVGGQRLMKDRELLTVNLPHVKARSEFWAKKITEKLDELKKDA